MSREGVAEGCVKGSGAGAVEAYRNCRWLLVIFNVCACLSTLLLFFFLIFVAVSGAAFAAFLCVRHPFVIKKSNNSNDNSDF